MPIDPKSAEFLAREHHQLESVFQVQGSNGKRMGTSRLISQMGKASQNETEPSRFVTSHNLRRSFGTR